MRTKVTRLLSLLLACMLLFSMLSSVGAVSNRASDYFSYTDVWATPQGNGKFIVEFDINATHTMQVLGADKIYIWEQQSDGSYDNVRTFNRNFKKVTGMSPLEYRASHRESTSGFAGAFSSSPSAASAGPAASLR